MRQALIITLCLMLTPVSTWGITLEGKVIKVADGDTITIIDNSDNKYRIRLGGIDPPEKDQP